MARVQIRDSYLDEKEGATDFCAVGPVSYNGHGMLGVFATCDIGYKQFIMKVGGKTSLRGSDPKNRNGWNLA